MDALARSGFVVFKIDLRGFEDSEGEPAGTYFSPAYAIDAIPTLKSLQTLDYVEPQGIGLWGHSMAGNLTLRAMFVEPAIQAGVIWAGAVYSYDDFTRYAIDDPSYNPAAAAATASQGDRTAESARPTARLTLPHPTGRRSRSPSISTCWTRRCNCITPSTTMSSTSATPPTWRQLWKRAGKVHKFYQYEGGGHNINSPYFNAAMKRTIAFFQEHL